MTKEQFEESIKTIAPEDSLVILQIPEEDIHRVSKSLSFFIPEIERKHNITFLLSPLRYPITIVPPGSKIYLRIGEEQKEETKQIPANPL